MNILQFLRGLQRNKISREGNYQSALYHYRTSDNRQFTISENGWHIINKFNAIADNSALTSLTADRLVKLHQFSTSYDQYNYLIHPSTIEGTSGDHVLITVAKPDTLVTKDNLEKTKSELMDEWSHKGKIEKLNLELVERPKIPNLPKSAYVQIQLEETFEEYFSIQTPENCVVVSCSASIENIYHYKKIMFEIIDSIEVRV